MKSRKINLSTVIFEVGIDLFDGNEINAYWSVQFIVSINVTNFNFFFLKQFIQTVIVSDSDLKIQQLVNAHRIQN